MEEEYLLLDSGTGLPSDQAEALIEAVPEHRGRADRELFSSQLETATPICRDAAEAEASLIDFRTTVSREAARLGIVLAGTGLPPSGGDRVGTVTPRDRYRAIEAEVRSVAAHQYVTGVHVHVEIPSRDAGVDVLKRVARWVPALLALTANSPIWCGEPTGFASWRYIMGLSWPISGYPPPFSSGSEYDRAVEHLVASGVLLDTGVVTWAARLSENFPTIELRIADAQTEARDTVAYGVLVRALIEHSLREMEAGVEQSRFLPGLLDGAVWLAARNGLESELVDPKGGHSLAAFEFVDRMIEMLEPTLAASDDLSRVEQYLDRLRSRGSRAAQQLRRFEEDGLNGLLELYRSGSEREPEPAAPHPASTAL